MSDSWLLPQLFVARDAVLLVLAVLVNVLFTFTAAAGIALLAARLSGSARLAKFILFTPWLRALWDTVQGAAPNAFVLSEHHPSAGVLEQIQLGVGRMMLPLVDVQLAMSAGGRAYAYSVGEAAAHWVVERCGSGWTALLLGAVLTVSLVLLGARAVATARWFARLRRLEQAALHIEEVTKCSRRVRIVTIAADLRLSPFTSGVLRPRIWLPEALTPDEKRAVVEHELAHVIDADVLLFAGAGVMADLFWFVPGVRGLERRLRGTAEQAADARAIRRGVPATTLAAAIVQQAERQVYRTALPALGGSARQLRRRIRALKVARRERAWTLLLRGALSVALTASVFLSSFAGAW